MSDDRIDPHYTWPLVLLTDLSASSQAKLSGLVKSTLEDDLKSHSDQYYGTSAKAENATHQVEVKLRVWSPTRRLLESIAQQGPHRDSQSNLHALAVLAYRSGRPRIIVADEATKSQLSGRFLEDRDIYSLTEGGCISVILLSTRRDPDSSEWSIFARRAVCSLQGETMFRMEEFDPDPQEKAFKSVHKSWGPLWTHVHIWRGMMLYDPDEEPFKPRTADTLEREYYANAVITAFSRYLPTELAIQISNTNSPPIKMPVWNRRPSNTHMVIFLLYPTTSEDVENTYQKLKGALSTEYRSWHTEPPMTLELVSLDRHRMKTRRDLLNFWNEYRVWDAGLGKIEHGVLPLFYLHRPLSAPDEAQFGVLGSNDQTTSFARMTFSNIYTCRGSWGHFIRFRKYGSQEIVCAPDEPFFIDPPLWLPIINSNWVRAAVFLTNKTSSAAKQILKQIMVPSQNNPSSLEYLIIPWREDAAMVDGKVEDIWELLQALYMHPEMCEIRTISFICVDRQFEVDRSFILVQADEFKSDPGHDLLQHLPFPRLRGFKYTRASGGLAYLGYPKENTINVDAVDHDWSRYRRPGWPAPGVLPDDPVEDVEYVDGSAYP